MKIKAGARRKLRAESLETRQLLHGGAFAGGAAPSAEAVSAMVFSRLDVDENGVINAEDGASEDLLERWAGADTDTEDGGITQDELTTHLEARLAERTENDGSRAGRRGQREGVGRGGGRMGPMRPDAAERVDSLFENDADGNGLSADEVSERVWERFSAADGADGTEADGAVTQEELEAHREALRAERFDAAFARLDTDESGGITVDEVSERRWERISVADTGGGEDGAPDGVVTQDELQTLRDARIAEREAEREADVADGNSDAETGEGEAVTDTAEAQAARRVGFQRAVGLQRGAGGPQRGFGGFRR